MNERTQDRLFAACGIAWVILQLGGFVVGAASGGAFVTLASSPAKVAHALAKPAGTGVWVGAYFELLSVGAFLAFAIWATAKLGGGLLGAVARSAATSYAAITIASLCVWGAAEFRARARHGHAAGNRAHQPQRSTLRRQLVPVGLLPTRGRRPRLDLGAACARLERDRHRPAHARRSGGTDERSRTEHRRPLVHLDRLGEHLPRLPRTGTSRRSRHGLELWASTARIGSGGETRSVARSPNPFQPRRQTRSSAVRNDHGQPLVPINPRYSGENDPACPSDASMFVKSLVAGSRAGGRGCGRGSV